jgi:hypothetical protein
MDTQDRRILLHLLSLDHPYAERKKEKKRLSGHYSPEFSFSPATREN